MTRTQSQDKNVHSLNLKAALQYIEAGYPVLPLHSLNADRSCTCSEGGACPYGAGKHPRIRNWQRRASTDETTVRGWWHKWPDAHVGVMPPEDCVIFDIDPRNGGDRTLEALCGVAAPQFNTPTQRSGGGGLHYVFRTEQRVQSPGAGIDVKQHRRGYVVAWPSAHASGGIYQWIIDPFDTDPVMLPPALARGAVKKSDSSELDASPLLRSNVKPAEAKAALRKLDPDCAYETWIKYGQALKLDYGDKGWALWHEWSARGKKYPGEDECHAKWNTFNLNARAGDVPVATAATIVYDAQEARAAPTTEPLVVRAHQLHAAFSAGDIYEPRMYLPQVLSEGCIALQGPPKSGKTWMMLDLARALCSGGDVLGWQPVQRLRSVAVLALEEGEETKKFVPNHRVLSRWRAMKGTADELKPLAFYFNLPPFDEGGLVMLSELIAKHDALLIDSAAILRLGHSGERAHNIWQRDYYFIKPLHELAAQHHKLIYLLMHTSKGAATKNRDATDAVAGTGGINAALDGQWVLQPMGAGAWRLTVQGRDMLGAEYELRWHKGAARWVNLGPMLNITPQQQVVLDALLEQVHEHVEGEHMTYDELSAALGLSASTVRGHVAALLACGMVRNVAGRGSPRGTRDGAQPAQLRPTARAYRRAALLTELALF